MVSLGGVGLTRSVPVFFAEAMALVAIESHVVRRFGVSTGQFYTWRKAMLRALAAL